MPSRIEDYALLGDTETAALVARDGSIDWLCLPRFDSPACFAALLGTPDHGRWQIGPADGSACVRRAYRDGTLVLESRFETSEGAVTLVDVMPPRDERANVVRLVRGESGRVRMRMELAIRFDYGSVVPWVRRIDGRPCAVGGPDGLCLTTPVAVRGEGLRHVAEFTVSAGDEVPFVLTWYPSHERPGPGIDAPRAVEDADRWWREWSARLGHDTDWHDAVERSLTVLKALTYAPSGGLVAAPTTSLPEELGGVRNWDYRYCWLRDATFTLVALLASGHTDEALDWRGWLLRAVAGDPSQLQIMYGARGERRLPEMELPWLPGYEGSAPVRIGNAASDQFQLDVYGEVIDCLHQARKAGIASDQEAWALERALLVELERRWVEPDEGLWEVRSGQQHFTHSKMMAWVAMDRAVRAAEKFGLPGPVARWRETRAQIHDEVCERGWDESRGSFVQAYGSKNLDASLLMMPLVGFLPADDPRVRSTIEAIERELAVEGFVHRYDTDAAADGVGGGEGAFLMCTFWMADCLELLGRHDDACAYFQRLLDLRNDVGLLSEEYDVARKRLVGNFPQAFSHVALVSTARYLSPRQEEDRTG